MNKVFLFALSFFIVINSYGESIAVDFIGNGRNAVKGSVEESINKDSIESQINSDVKVNELQEVTVSGNSIIRTRNSVTLFPSKRNKSFACGGLDVLSNANLPEIQVNPATGTVSSTDGTSVTFFIDYQPASMQQLADLRPQDIMKIEILSSPEDPRFQNAKVVANYIMKKYEYGGYTKFNGDQFVPAFVGRYGIYSKFSYKKMSYDVSAGLNYNLRGNSTGERSDAVYEFGSDELSRKSKTEKYKSTQLLPRVSARINYSAAGVSIVNSFGFNYSRLNPFRSTEQVTYSKYLDSGESHMNKSQRNRNFVWNGNYYFALPREMSISFYANLNLGDNKDISAYALNEGLPIRNNITEKIIDVVASLTLSKKLGAHNIGVSAAGGWNRHKLVYEDVLQNDVYNREGYGQIALSAGLEFNKFSLRPSLTLSLSSEKMNDVKFTKLYPKAFVPFYLQFTRRSSLNGSFEFAMGSADAAQRSPVLVRINEIDAVRGNENLKSYKFYNGRLGYSYTFGSWLSTRVDAQFNCQDNILVPVYSIIDYQSFGKLMVRDVINDGAIYNSSLTLSLSGNYFKNNLSVRLSGSINNYAQRGDVNRTKYYAQYWLNASYYIGDFRINGYFSPSSRQYTAWYDVKTPMYWYLGASWAHNGLFIDVRFNNPFIKSYKSSTKTFSCDIYSYKNVAYSPEYHQSVKIAISYSFGYGKKLNRNNEVGKLQDAGSIILNK